MLESTSVVYDGLKAIHANEIKEYKYFVFHIDNK